MVTRSRGGGKETTQGVNPGLLHCRQILYQLSHQGNPRILEWVPIPSPGDLPDPGIEPGSPASQADSLPAEISVQFSSVQFSCSIVSDSLRPHESQHTRPPCPSPTPGVHSDLRPLSLWCHPAISSSVVPFSSCPQSLPASGSFPMSQLFAWGGPSAGVSALASFLSKNTQGWSPLEWTGWISLKSKGLSRAFSNIMPYLWIWPESQTLPTFTAHSAQPSQLVSSWNWIPHLLI